MVTTEQRAWAELLPFETAETLAQHVTPAVDLMSIPDVRKVWRKH